VSKHTPGPWDVQQLASCQAIQAGPKIRICHLPDHIEHDGEPCGSIESQDKTQDEIDANARLIAAAPELLAALRDLQTYLDECNPFAGPAVVGILRSKVDAAIAKAEGST